jgi:hypothetical protein
MNNKKILILGGTQMIGLDFVEYLLENNSEYNISIANRGKTNPDIFKEVSRIIIDRNSPEKCESLSNLYFDKIIDFSCYDIHHLSNILKYIKYSKYYVLSSLCSKDRNVLNDPSHWLYGYCHGKNRLENYIIFHNLINFNIIRPCVIFGKNDYTGRFYEKNNICYWKHDNTIVQKNKYYIPVREFTESLYALIEGDQSQIIEPNIIHINGEGTEIINTF